MGNSHNENVRHKRNAVEVVVTDDLSSALKELRHVNEPDLSDCYSINDICDKLGESRRNVYNIVKDCMANGTCEYAGKRREIGIDRRMAKIPVYRFKFKNKKRNQKQK